jgi:hypothetical protein
MYPAVAAILDGMPDPRSLHLQEHDGRCVIMAGAGVLYDYAATDLIGRNFAVCSLRQLGFTGRALAGMTGLSEEYISRIYTAWKDGGSAALVQQDRRGAPGKVTARQWEKARTWRDEGVTDAEIGRRLDVAHTTVGRALGSRVLAAAPGGEPSCETPDPQEPLFTGAALQSPAEPGAESVAVAETQAAPEPEAAEPVTGASPAPCPARGTVRSRYAGSMLMHAFLTRAAAEAVLADAAQQPGDVQFLTGVSMCFALGAATVEGFKHMAAADAGPLTGMARLPGLRALRPELHRIADAADPVALQGLFAAAMLAADPVTSGVYYVDGHFIPYTGAKPVAKGWNNKRGHAERGHADTHVTAYDGRAVCFVSGEPSGLTVTLPKALAELKKAAGPGTPVMLGFDRGGAYAQVFTHCREQNVHWVTYRRAPLAVPARLPVLTTVTYGGKTKVIAWAEETADIKDYGQARQITLSEHGQVALQILTSDFEACPADLLSWLKSRWREENFLKYASQNYGIDKICDYLATITENTKPARNPARDTANAAVRSAQKALDDTERELAALLADPAQTPAAKNKQIPALERKIIKGRKAAQAAVTARNPVPARLPANQIDPGAQAAMLNAGRRGLQMVLRLLAHNAEHWLSNHLNAYLRDDDEYRAITRQTIIRGLDGTITCTPAAVTVTLERPASRRITKALGLLLDEINADPPHMPGDKRPITYHITAQPSI